MLRGGGAINAETPRYNIVTVTYNTAEFFTGAFLVEK